MSRILDPRLDQYLAPLHPIINLGVQYYTWGKMIPETALLETVNEYSALERELGARIVPDSRFEELVSFESNETMPVHRWYYFKEGYSHRLVEALLLEFRIQKGSVILDPFAGSGTTLLTGQWKGMSPVGVDINPFFTFVQRTKLDWFKYDPARLKHCVKRLAELQVNKEPGIVAPELSTFKKVYSPDVLNQLLLLKQEILREEDSLTRNFLLLGLSSILEEVSKIRKEGKGLKFKKGKKIPPVKEALLQKLGHMLDDLYQLNTFMKVERTEGKALTMDTRKLELSDLKLDGLVDFIMFSPPYLNTFDYTEVYKLELWFLDFVRNYQEFKALRETTLRSHNLVEWKPTRDWENYLLNEILEHVRSKKLWSEIIPVMIQGYFDDMFASLGRFNEVIKNDGYCVIVVGNSAYANIPVPTDLLLAKAGQEAGFTPVEIRIARRLGTSSQQLRVLKEPLRRFLRESIIILKKE